MSGDKTGSPKLSKTAAAVEARIRGAERAEEQATKSAKSTLIHYFGLAVDDMTGDMSGEIETLVEDLIEAAAARAERRRLTEQQERAFKKRGKGTAS